MGVVQREHGDKARFPWLKTPNLDHLAAQGTRFRNAFVVNSLCAPSRASFLTGQYGHKNGIVNNHTPFNAANVTWASLLRRAGYITGYIGKWHMGQQSGQRPGFDFSASFIGQGKYFDCPVEVNGTSTPTKGWIDDVSVARQPRAQPRPARLCRLSAARSPLQRQRGGVMFRTAVPAGRAVVPNHARRLARRGGVRKVKRAEQLRRSARPVVPPNAGVQGPGTTVPPPHPVLMGDP